MLNFNPILGQVADTTNTDYIAQSIGGGIVAIIILIAMWKLYTKAGKPGWAAIIPIYNTIVLLQIVKRPIWWILLLLIPFVNIVVLIVLYYDLAKAFGKGIGFTLLIILLPFIAYPVLGFGKSQYDPSALER